MNRWRLSRYRHVIITSGNGVPRRDDNLPRVITSITPSASPFVRRASFAPRFTTRRAYRACHCFPTVTPVHRDGAAACRFCHWPTRQWTRAAHGTSGRPCYRPCFAVTRRAFENSHSLERRGDPPFSSCTLPDFGNARASARETQREIVAHRGLTIANLKIRIRPVR